MQVRFTKSAPTEPADRLSCIRIDGTRTESGLPRQGILPHDAFHFVVETTLGWPDAFFGQVAGGATLDRLTAELHGPNAKRAGPPRARQSEALVECLQANQWGGATEATPFKKVLGAACRRRGVKPPVIDATTLTALRAAIRAFGAAWRPLNPGQSLERTFAP
ncbi:MAG: hypothetical protein WCQ89_19680 [Verrucomicrobiota bacterium]|jgi:hypothetical protein